MTLEEMKIALEGSAIKSISITARVSLGHVQEVSDLLDRSFNAMRAKDIKKTYSIVEPSVEE